MYLSVLAMYNTPAPGLQSHLKVSLGEGKICFQTRSHGCWLASVPLHRAPSQQLPFPRASDAKESERRAPRKKGTIFFHNLPLKVTPPEFYDVLFVKNESLPGQSGSVNL